MVQKTSSPYRPHPYFERMRAVHEEASRLRKQCVTQYRKLFPKAMECLEDTLTERFRVRRYVKGMYIKQDFAITVLFRDRSRAQYRIDRDTPASAR
jgi:hypothetical protein